MNQVTYKCFGCGQQVGMEQSHDSWIELKTIRCCRCKRTMECLSNVTTTTEIPKKPWEVQKVFVGKQ